MEDEIITLSNSSRSTKPLDTINILVVDDDTTCLSVIAAILKKCKYQVVTVKNPIDALYMLRINGNLFDLVVTDVHMPYMNGFELQQAITEEFNLPVVLMSADDGKDVMLKGLETGAAFFITKPVSTKDVRDLWQYVDMKKNTKAFIVEGTETTQEKENSPEVQTKRNSKRALTEYYGDKKEEDQDVNINVSKKAKVVWTNALHNKFLEAISALGLHRSVPNKILELMQVPGLTRDNVASHLQKYRLFLKRVSDSSHMITSPSESSLANRAFQLNYGSGNNSMFMINKFSPFTQQGKGNLALTRALHGNIGGNDVKGLSSNPFFRQEGFSPSSMLRNTNNTWKPNLLSQIGIQREPNNIQGGLVFDGGISNDLTNIRSHLLEKYLTETPTPVASLGGVSNTTDVNKAHTLNYASGLERTTNPNFTPSNIGFQLANTKPLVQKEYQVSNASSSFDGINRWINNLQDTNHLAQGVSLGGFGGGGVNHYSTPTFSSNNPGTGLSVPPTFGNLQGTQPPIHPIPASDNIFTPQQFSLDDSTNTVFNQLENPFQLQDTGGEGGIKSSFPNIGDHMNNYFQWFNEDLNQQGRACLTDVNNYGNGVGTSHDNTVVQSTSEHDEDALLEYLLASDPFEGEENLGAI